MFLGTVKRMAGKLAGIACKTTAALVALLVMATAAASQTTIPAGCSDSVITIGQGTPWKPLGIPDVSSRPSWVSVCAERRLRLLDRLANIEENIGNESAAYFQGQGPGLAIGLVLDDGLYYSDGFGFRDAAKQYAPDETTIFATGSFSKVITGTTLLTFTDVPNPKIALSDRADQFLPELDFVCPSFDKAQCTCPNSQTLCMRKGANRDITMANLVSHTSGLADIMEQNFATLTEWDYDIERSWLRFTPGTFSAYSGVGTEGVGLIETRLSNGDKFPDVVNAHLFMPLGMNHSTMDETTIPQSMLPLVAQRWSLNSTNAGWSFSQADGPIYQPNQVMLLPAGGFMTNVSDMSQFLTMWLTNTAPVVSGRPLIKISSLKSAVLPQVNVTAKPPASCSGPKATGSNDTNFPPVGGFYYSSCAPADNFGVNWALTNLPFVSHNGSVGVSGSETEFNEGAHMAATGLVSTNPYPAGPTVDNVVEQPTNLDGSFIDNVVFSTLLSGGIAADAQKTWSGELSVGTARLLWLTGAAPPNGNGLISLVQTPQMGPDGKPIDFTPPQKIPAGYVKIGAWAVSPARLQYEATLEQQFDAKFVNANIPNPVAIEFFLGSIFNGADRCSTFRIRHVHSGNDITLRLRCAGGAAGPENLNVRMATSSTGLIAGLVDASISNDPF